MSSCKMADKKTPLVFGYVRVSTDNQLENYSIDEQIVRIESYCKAKGWILLKIYTDGGFSGGNVERPALQQMLAAVREQQVDAIVVYKLDRLSRSQKDTLTLIEDEFLSHNTDFVSINENFDTSSPFGRAMIGILSVFAQLEKDQITERFTMGRIGRSKAGYYHGGAYAPLGYDYTDGLLVVNEYQAAMVRSIYAQFLAGKSINAIWHDMESKYVRNYSGKWSAAKIQIILTNNIYIGKVKFAGVAYDGLHAPIITKQDFYAANQLLSASSRTDKLSSNQKTPFRASTLLSGIIYCRRCGARYAGAHGYYKCYSRSKTARAQIADPSCRNDNWKIEALNDAVVLEIERLISNPPLIQSIVHESSQNEAALDTAAVVRRIKAIDSKIEKLIDLYQVSAIPMETLTGRVNELNAERKSLNNQIALEAKRAETASTTFTEYLKKFANDFYTSPLEAKRLLVSSIIKRIDLDGVTLKIAWRI